MRSTSAAPFSKWARRAHNAGSIASRMAIVALVLAGFASVACADDDLPARVGRVSDFGGQLYLSTADRPDDWTPVGVNYPVTSGDNLWVSSDGRAEIDYGGGQFRLAGDTNLNVARLDDRQLTLFVARGRLIVRVRALDADEVARIDTPNTQVALTRPGLYRIEVAADSSTTKVGVREGEGFVALANGQQQALPGQMVSVSGIEPLAADFRNGFGVDGFDTWSANRDRYYERARATPDVSRQMVGVVELDTYGSWEDNPTYGAVWYPPPVAADWSPYQDGYWTTVGEWGLTWVDAAPWGYAPSHYGRWVRVKGRWGWCPGPRVGRPHWAPALVGWYGGVGWGITAKGGAPVYAWVPLGWGDAYSPKWRGCSQSCWNRYNKPFGVDAADRTNPRARYSYLDLPGAMTAVPGATLVGRTPVSTTRVPLPASQLSSAPVLATPPSVVSTIVVGQAFRPGERGTPTPASTLYSHSRRTSVVLPASSATASPSAGRPVAGGESAFSTRSQVAPRVLPAPASSAPTRAASGHAIESPSSPHGGVTSPTRAPSKSAPVAVTATGDRAARSGAATAGAVAIQVPSAAAVQRGSSTATVPATGIALPPSGVVVPSTRTALPPPVIALPPPVIALPAVRAPVAAPATQPAATVVVPAATPAVVVPAGGASGRGSGDAGPVRAFDRAPVVAPAIAPPGSPR